MTMTITSGVPTTRPVAVERLHLPASGGRAATPCIVHDPDDVDPGKDVPDEAESLGYVEGLGIDDLRSVRDNARLQGRGPTADELLQALTDYLQNDAFITFD